MLQNCLENVKLRLRKLHEILRTIKLQKHVVCNFFGISSGQQMMISAKTTRYQHHRHKIKFLCYNPILAVSGVSYRTPVSVKTYKISTKNSWAYKNNGSTRIDRVATHSSIPNFLIFPWESRWIILTLI